MYLKNYAAALTAVLPIVAAQTYSDCNPTKKSCSPDSGQKEYTFSTDFTKDTSLDGWETAAGNVTFDDNGAAFTINQKGDAPTIDTKGYFFFGRVDVEMKAAPGTGVVSSIVMESDDLDEIDWEWLGGDNTQVQSNYFGKGDTASYDRGAFHPVDQPTSRLHSYVIDWNPQRIEWIIDGTVVRTLNYKAAQGGTRYPQTPMQVKLGTWCAGLPNSPKGTVEWAGGYTNFALAPFDAWYQSITVIDYCGGSAACTEDVQQYVYGDRSGSMQSIQVVR
jgi:beta-glucanase (GH16 family)